MVVPDDVYKEDVDFVSLAMQHAGFAKKLKSNGQLDFSDPESVRQLTKALLQRDFSLTIELPEDRLCPPVPNRFNYIVFIQKLIDSTRADYRGYTPSDERTLGLDIGTGASAIYPLLACRQRSNWFFLATEIDTTSREYAVRNVKTNSLQSRVKIVAPDGEGEDGSKTILPLSHLRNFDDYAIRIQITNPPFYASSTEMLESAKQKQRPPNSACTGAPIEMITPGGETAFVKQLIQESTQNPARTTIQWFSSMLGKLSSVSVVIDHLKRANCTNYVVSEFVQGEKTRRWCVAWSWCALRPPSRLSRGITNGAIEKKLLPFPTEFDFQVDITVKMLEMRNGGGGQLGSSIQKLKHSITLVSQFIDSELSNLDIQWRQQEPSKPVNDTIAWNGIGQCKEGDVWSRKARRQRHQRSQQSRTDTVMLEEVTTEQEEDEDGDEEEDEHEYQDSLPLAFRITITSATPVITNTIVVTVTWLQGHDSVMFESFCGWIKRRVGIAFSSLPT